MRVHTHVVQQERLTVTNENTSSHKLWDIKLPPVNDQRAFPDMLTPTEIHRNNISKCLNITRSSLQLLVDTLEIPGLDAILNTTESLLKLAEVHLGRIY